VKKKMVLLMLPLCLLLVVGLFNNQGINFKVFADGGTPDAYGDCIYEVSVWQSSVMKGNVTYSNYTSGVQVKVDALTATQFNCTVKLNNTFASSTSEAQSNTRVYVNITYTNGTVVVSSTEMTDYAASEVGDYYYVKSYYTWDDPTNHPIAGVTYYVWFRYDVYR